jgi:HSP20 family protein
MDFVKVKFDQKLDDFQSKMQKMVDGMRTLGGPMLSISDSGWTPEADIYEVEDTIFVNVNLAGVMKEDIRVSFHDNHLRIGGKRTQRNLPGPIARYHQLELGHGDFERTFRIPAVIDEKKIEASYADGILTVNMKIGKNSKGVDVQIAS